MTESTYRYNSVLLVDDNSTDLFINKRILEITRFAKNIIVTNSSQEALDYLNSECNSAEQSPDVVFLDHFMPVMDGMEFLTKFEALPAHITSKSKVVMLSVLEERHHSKEYDQRAIHQIISKPLTQDKLELAFTPSSFAEKMS